jgi:hypothetical protein
VGLTQHQLTLAERDLDITIKGDMLTATYKLTAPAQDAAAAAALIAVKGDAGGELVSHVLGWISVGEFRYGPTGSHYTLVPLTFQRPQLYITTAGVPEVTVTSDPMRLFLQSQHIRIYEPAKVITGGRDLIDVKATDVRVLAASGATRTLTKKCKADRSRECEANLSRDGGTVNMAISLGTSTGQRWLSGLRRTGRMIVPVVDGLFSQLASLFVYIVLLWTLVFIQKNLPDSQLVVAARNAVSRWSWHLRRLRSSRSRLTLAVRSSMTPTIRAARLRPDRLGCWSLGLRWYGPWRVSVSGLSGGPHLTRLASRGPAVRGQARPVACCGAAYMSQVGRGTLCSDSVHTPSSCGCTGSCCLLWRTPIRSRTSPPSP